MSPRTVKLLLLVAAGLVTAAANAASLTVSPASILPGGIVTAQWSGISAPNASDWVGLYTPSAPNYPEMSRRNTTGTASGSVPFTVPTSVTLGTYQLRLFAAGTYTLLATSGNFTVGLSLGGTVTLNGAPLANVAFAATNGGACGSSNANGQYTCSVPSGWSGTITPQLSGYIFTQSSRSYSNVTVAQTAQNYTATQTFQLNGTVLFNGAPLANVAFAATNGVNCTSSNASGQYSCTAPQGWSGTVTPALTGYMFTPATHSYSHVTANQSAQDYAATNQAYFLSGTVSVNGVPLANVALAAANGGVCSPSNAWGQYSCAVAPGWSGTVTPSAIGYSFTPSSRILASIVADQNAQDFAATMDSASAPMFFVHVDHLNTPRLAANQSGLTVWKWDQQEPFGSNLPDANPSGLGAFEFPLRFPGQYADKETNLAYNVNRDLDSSIGRYVQSDPIGLEGGINTYAYVSGKPLSFIDPTGQQAAAVAEVVIGGGIICLLTPGCKKIVEDALKSCIYRTPSPFLPDDPYSPEETSRRQSEWRRQLGAPSVDPDSPIPDQGPGRDMGGHKARGGTPHETGERNVNPNEEHSKRPKDNPSGARR